MGLRHSFLAVVVAAAAPVFAQTTTPPANPAPLKTLPDGWEQIDQRLVFLTIELSNTEASLTAINKAIRVNGYNQSVKQNQAQTVRRGNEVMDRNAGGPVNWESFYGRTAEKFFYHPTDPNSHYITRTDLGQTDPRRDVSAGSGVPSRQGLPIQQRPPQLDYIYRANSNAAARADQEAAALGNQIGRLVERRRQLENEQSALWCKIAFEALESRKILKKPIYRFGLRLSGTDKTSVQRLEACKASVEFVGLADRLAAQAMANVDQNQAGMLSRLHDSIAGAYHDLDQKLDAQRQVAVELVDQNTPLGKFYALSSRMDDTTKNMVDALRLSQEGEQTNDDLRKNTFRALVQESLLTYAEAVLTMDQELTEMTAKWNIVADPDATATQVKMPTIAVDAPQPAPTPQRMNGIENTHTEGAINLLDESWQSVDKPQNVDKPIFRAGLPPNWRLAGGTLIVSNIGLSIATEKQFGDFTLHAEFSLPRGCNTGIYLRGRYELKLCDPANAQHIACGSIYGLIQPSHDSYIGPDQWNNVDVTLIGRSITVVLNGSTVIDRQVLSGPTAGALDNREDAPGPVLLHCHRFSRGAKYRNLVVKPIEAAMSGSGAPHALPTAASPTAPPALGQPMVTIETANAVRVEKLERGSPRLYDSKPLRVIEGVSPDLYGLDFTSIPQRIEMNYTIMVKKAGKVYAFGPRHTQPSEIFGDDLRNWQQSDDLIKGTMVHHVYWRKVTEGEVIKVRGFEISIAAEGIALNR